MPAPSPGTSTVSGPALETILSSSRWPAPRSLLQKRIDRYRGPIRRNRAHQLQQISANSGFSSLLLSSSPAGRPVPLELVLRADSSNTSGAVPGTDSSSSGTDPPPSPYIRSHACPPIVWDRQPRAVRRWCRGKARCSRQSAPLSASLTSTENSSLASPATTFSHLLQEFGSVGETEHRSVVYQVLSFDSNLLCEKSSL